MELLKRNIHNYHVKLSGQTQVTLEEDMNIPDSKPDVTNLVFEKGRIQIEEVKPTEDHVNIRGRLLFSVLYETKEDNQKLCLMEGKIPFEEQMYLEGVRGSDTVIVKGILEDLSIGMINSRKLSVQSLFTLTAITEELFDEEIPTDLYLQGENMPLEYRKCKINLSEIAVMKNDIMRIREEMTVPQNAPNIFHILWQDIKPEDMEWKALSDNISVNGDLHVFVLYEGEGENPEIRTFETVLPISQNIECNGAKEGMICDISYEIGHMDLDIRPDFDGEERVFGLEMVLDLNMKLYEEDNPEIITDVYGVEQEVNCEEKETSMQQLLMRINGKSKITGKISIASQSSKVLQILHSEAYAQVDEEHITEDGIEIKGSLNVNVMYVTGDDQKPYNSVKEMIPFTYLLEVPGIETEDLYRMNVSVGQLQVMMIDSEEMDVKAVLEISAIIFRKVPINLISHIECAPLDHKKVNDLPGMIIYVVGEEDNLWNIGKKYYVPVSRIREVNNLQDDNVHPREQLLIVR